MKPQARKDVAFEAAVKLHQAGQLDKAERAYLNIIRLRPKHAQALANLGLIYRKTAKFEQARAYYERSLQADPHAALTWMNLSNLFLLMRQDENAAMTAERAIKESPALDAAYDNLGRALLCLNRYEEAERALLRAVKLNPKLANAWNNLGSVFQRQSRLAEAAQAYQQAVLLDPSFIWPFSNLLFCMHFDRRWSTEEIFATHLRWAQQFEKPILREGAKFQQGSRAPNTRPRVAFISADLCHHAVTMFLKPLIDHWPHDRFELGFYPSVSNPDDTTQWYKERADFWADVFALSNEAAATRIAQDQADVLIDLSGHTGVSRLIVLAYRPAPVQMSWLGYFDTTGMESVDFILADPITVPPSLEHLFSEKVLRLPDGFVCYDPPSMAPEPGPLPALDKGHVTFGSQNQLAKVTDEVISLWAEVLRAVPSARFFFQAKAFNDRLTIDRFAKAFAERGIDPGRIDFVPAMPQQEILRNYRLFDVALDPFPCAGGTTTCESLWMGVPVITLLGDRFGGRHSASHLNNVGMSQFIATDKAQYIDIARSLASDLSALSGIRQGLRQRMLLSPLCNGKRFAANFADTLEVALRISDD